MHFEHLPEGDYCMLVDIDWRSDLAQKEFVMSSYGVDDAEIYCNSCKHKNIANYLG
jgi:hypothetical protein